TPYNPEYADYLQRRKLNKQSRNSWFEPVMPAL
ncbi:maturase, partial [Parashewanella curva]